MKTFFTSKADHILLKMIVVGVLIIIMLLPIGLIQSLVEERQAYQVELKEEVYKKIGGVQSVTGPVLALPYTKKDGKSDRIYILPQDLRVRGEIQAEEKGRSLYNAPVLLSQLHFEGNFVIENMESLHIQTDKIKWNEVEVLVSVPFLQGIKNEVILKFNGTDYNLLSKEMGNEASLLGSALVAQVDINPQTSIFNFSIDLNLSGTEGLLINPIAKRNDIELKTEWKNLSSVGNYLPTKKEIVENKTNVHWNVFDYNRNYVPMWIGENNSFRSEAVGLEFIYPINQYQLVTRSVKYAIVFIVLTFAVFFLVEVLSRKRIHPIQYLLVSSALVLFYTLLLAISEHIGFELAYLFASFATISLITAYCKTMFKSLRNALKMGVFLTALYLYLFVMLQLDELALLFGAIGLFIVLAIIMFFLRNVNWYKDKASSNSGVEDVDNKDNI